MEVPLLVARARLPRAGDAAPLFLSRGSRRGPLPGLAAPQRRPGVPRGGAAPRRPAGSGRSALGARRWGWRGGGARPARGPSAGPWEPCGGGPRSEHRRAGVHAPAASHKATGSAPAGRPTRRRSPPAPGARGLREGASRAKVTQRPARGLGPRPQRTCSRAEGESPDPPAAPPPRAARRPAPRPRAPQLTSPHLVVVVVLQPPPHGPSRGRPSSAGPAPGARSPASRSTSREKSRPTEGPRRLPPSMRLRPPHSAVPPPKPVPCGAVFTTLDRPRPPAPGARPLPQQPVRFCRSRRWLRLQRVRAWWARDNAWSPAMSSALTERLLFAPLVRDLRTAGRGSRSSPARAWGG